MWQHSSRSQLESLQASDGERWAAPGDVPWLVLELARSQLRSLLEEGFQASSGSEEEEALLQALADPDVAGVERPLPTLTSDSLSPSPTPSARKPRKTSSSSESGPASNA